MGDDSMVLQVRHENTSKELEDVGQPCTLARFSGSFSPGCYAGDQRPDVRCIATRGGQPLKCVHGQSPTLRTTTLGGAQIRPSTPYSRVNLWWVNDNKSPLSTSVSQESRESMVASSWFSRNRRGLVTGDLGSILGSLEEFR